VVDPDRLRVWVARLAAPLAFFFAATVLVVLVQRGLESDEGEAGSGGTPTEVETPTGPTTTSGPDGTTTTPGKGPCLANRTRVRQGDTLESIAARCGVDVDQIIELNPGIDPLALSPGQRVRIRPPATQG
jgi:LysM repeat protein